ncbi:hypothetical protein JYU20_00425 [Bacteroidales bacterium AH-315-I05]|nr:hypothetical protein [Bacteroidales bacterium AH-315-I05]
MKKTIFIIIILILAYTAYIFYRRKKVPTAEVIVCKNGELRWSNSKDDGSIISGYIKLDTPGHTTGGTYSGMYDYEAKVLPGRQLSFKVWEIKTGKVVVNEHYVLQDTQGPLCPSHLFKRKGLLI